MKVKFPKFSCYYSNSDHSPKSHWLRSTSTISLAVEKKQSLSPNPIEKQRRTTVADPRVKDPIAVETHSGSDSNTNIDDDDAAEYYRLQNDATEENHRLQNGAVVNQKQRGVSSIRLNDDVEGDNGSSSEEEEEEEDEEEIGGGSDSVIARAIREDESRRHELLTSENATMVIEVMRGISFDGVAPDWADRIPEENWIDRLRRLWQAPQI